MVNGSPTALTTGTFNVSTQDVTVFASDIADTVVVAAGDRVSIQLTQSTGTPVIKLATTLHCH
jgi:hypothetical protein